MTVPSLNAAAAWKKAPGVSLGAKAHRSEKRAPWGGSRLEGALADVLVRRVGVRLGFRSLPAVHSHRQRPRPVSVQLPLRLLFLHFQDALKQAIRSPDAKVWTCLVYLKY